MKTKTTPLKEIMAFLFGRKYYANIVNVRGTNECEICAYIFSSEEAVREHIASLNATLTYTFIETITFRSRMVYYDNSRKKLNR